MDEQKSAAKVVSKASKLPAPAPKKGSVTVTKHKEETSDSSEDEESSSDEEDVSNGTASLVSECD